MDLSSSSSPATFAANCPLHPLFFPPKPSQIRCFRLYRRRRLKLGAHLSLRPQFFHEFLSHNSVNFIAPALGFASGLALFLSNRTSDDARQNPERACDIGDWVLFTSPTPFNRFVLLRCPSVSFEGSEFLEDVNERLVKEDRHFVRLDSGRMQFGGVDGWRQAELEENLEYQRVCVAADDGGVISLDWPENLDLKEERGLDTTLLLVPGMAEGSLGSNIRSFVCEALKSGFFPIVMNPRGCAGSPLTTSRLFTAADSDDISTAVQFISKARPWTTLMAVGWGYGASMLTKYLAEVGEKTPLTAATCIDNPFDLEEASRASSHHVSADQRLLNGLKDILRSNKELFQGKRKGFDVEKALLAKSVRDFEEEISMVSYGFESIEDFYSECSTRGVVGNVKIPLLFIQTDDDGSVPLFSIPRSLIAENPFTSLLLCSCSPPIVTASDRTAISWCQHLTVEWLTAVELGLLKGRHPLLKDIDVTIRPSKGLSLVDGRASDSGTSVNKFLDITHSNSLKGYSVIDSKSALEESDAPAGTGVRFKQSSQRNLELNDVAMQDVNSGGLQQAGAGLIKEEEGGSVDVESGHVLQTAKVVMNMLDGTMPGTLTEEKKKKVLAAVGRGETLITALQDAVPEDVRGKLTVSVSTFMQTQGSKKFDGLLHMGSDSSSELMARIQENGRVPSSAEGSQDQNSLDQMKMTDNVVDDPDNNQLEKPAEFGNSHEYPNIPGQAEGTREASFDECIDQDGVIAQVVVEEDNDSQKRDNKNLQPALDQSMSTSDHNSPNFSVTQALDALTGIDDSTQVAVNSVFGVIEDMITQLEDSDDVNQATVDDGKEKKIASIDEKHGVISEHSAEKKGDNKNDLNAQSGTSDVSSIQNILEGSMDSPLDSISGCVDEQPMQSPSPVEGDCSDGSQRRNVANYGVRGEIVEDNQFMESELREENTEKLRYASDVPHYIIAHPYGGSLRNEYFHKYLLPEMPTESLDVDTTTALFLDYIPEEGQWKLLEQPADKGNSIADNASSDVNKKKMHTHLPTKASDIEPSYVVFDTDKHHPISKYELVDNMNEQMSDGSSDEIIYFIRSIILDSLKVEVDRKLGVTDIRQMESHLARDLEFVADAVSLAVGFDKERKDCFEDEDVTVAHRSQKVGTLNGECIVTAISSAVQETMYLRTVLPLGVIVGSSLAVLRKFFDVAPLLSDVQNETSTLHEAVKSGLTNKVSSREIDQLPTNKSDRSTTSDWSEGRGEKVEAHNQSKDAVMAGAVTAALGASALLVQQQDAFKNSGTTNSLSTSLKEEANDQKVVDPLEALDKSQNNIVTSLAEKAMSVAGPVVPTKEDGEVDHERLVALLADLGQKGGMLRLVGKVALLWGGIRGAMSLTDRLISFLHIGERPLFQRILGFVGMVLVLWSPVAVPFFPTLMHSWTTHTPSRIAELACVFGLYAAVLMLVMLWGKRIRGFENPLEQYGLDMTSWPKMRDLLKGIIGGILLVLSIQSVNSLLGYASFTWPPSLPSSSFHVLAHLKVYGHMILLFGRGIVIATGIALAEELLFRSWLPEEIASDFGYHRGIVISGLAFAIFQRSPGAIPGLWLLSLGLAGARQLSEGSLSVPIGLRAGIIASSFILQKGGFLTYKPNFPPWLIGSHPFQPFSGVVGFAFALVLALSLYPRQTLSRKKFERTIRE